MNTINSGKSCIIVLLMVCLPCHVFAQGPPDSKVKNCLITNVSIIDVENGAVVSNKTVETRDGLIYKISPAVDKKEFPDTAVIDGTGLFIIPGLVDSHVHYLDPKTFGPMCIANGVLFVREMGNVTKSAIKKRNALNSGKILGPEMITTGSPLDGDHPFIPQISLECKTPEEGRAAVKQQVAAGVNEIKTYSKLEKDVFLAIVDECNANKIKAVGHVPETVYIEDAAKAGLYTSEHMFGFGNVIAKVLNKPIKLKAGGMGADQDQFLNYPKVDKEQLQAELKKISSYGMAVCPTMIEMKCGTNLVEIFDRNYPNLDYISPMIWSVWKQMWEPQKGSVPMCKQLYPFYKNFLLDLYHAGFTLLVGTDLLVAGVIPGYSVHEEMAIWQESGIPAKDILRSATITPAKMFGIDTSLGSIKEGKKASFALLRANPLEDIKNIDQIESVFLRGRYFSRTDIEQLKQDVKKACQN